MAEQKKEKINLDTWCSRNGERGQRLRAEWLGLDENRKPVQMMEYTPGSHKKVYWKCQDCNHEWTASICHRTNNRNCPYCSGKRVSDKNSLLTYCNQNGEWGQRLMKEWTGIDSKGNKISIEEVSYGNNKKVQWQCIDCNNKWTARIADRTYKRSGCPNCCTTGTSYSEQFLYWSLKQLYPNTQNRYKVFISDKDPQGIEYDIAIPELQLCIEHSPTYWHKGKEDQDNYKKQLCKQHNIHLIQIIEDNYNEFNEEKFTENYICIPTLNSLNRDKYLIKIMSYILNSIGHSITEIDLELVKKNALKYSTSSIEYEKSLAYNFPELSKEWHKTLNSIQPSSIPPRTNLKVYWQCINCDYGKDGEWQAPPSRRTAKGYETGCPCCGYNWSDGKIHKTYGSTLVIKGVNDLQSQYPELAKEWNETLNTISPSEIKSGSNKRVYWQCVNCGYGSNGEWQAEVHSRTAKSKETGCPNCGYNWHKAEQGQPQKIKSKYKNYQSTKRLQQLFSSRPSTSTQALDISQNPSVYDPSSPYYDEALDF